MNRNTIKSLNHLATFLVDEILSMTDVELLVDKKRLLETLMENESCKKKYMCDVYFLPSLPENHPQYQDYRCMRKYWMGEFGFDRQERVKGFVRMELKPC